MAKSFKKFLYSAIPVFTKKREAMKNRRKMGRVLRENILENSYLILEHIFEQIIKPPHGLILARKRIKLIARENTQGTYYSSLTLLTLLTSPT
jgi:hypothetical protein